MVLNQAAIRKMMHGKSMEDENFPCIYALYSGFPYLGKLCACCVRIQRSIDEILVDIITD